MKSLDEFLITWSQGAITALLLAGFGAMWQFTLFRRNNFGLLFFLFWLFQVCTLHMTASSGF